MMIENISHINNDLSRIVNNAIAKKNPDTVQKEQDIEDSYVKTDESSEFSTYNNKGVVAKNHTVLPDKYNTNSLQGYIYYKGERMTQLELLERAVDSGAIELDESKSVNENYDKAWEVLVEDKAKPLFDWSTSLYSEDGKYKFRVENGEITGMTLARTADGVWYSDMVNDLANGVKPCDMPVGIFDLAHLDTELYDAACQIGSAKRLYDKADDKSLFSILFGFDAQQNEQNFAKMALENFNQNRYANWFEKYLGS